MINIEDELTGAEVDMILERYDQTEEPLKRRIVATAFCEIHRLRAANAELLEALEMAYRCCRVTHGGQSELCGLLENAIQKAKSGQWWKPPFCAGSGKRPEEVQPPKSAAKKV